MSQHSRKGTWGTGALETISSQLRRELPGLRGYSASALKNMRKFYEAWQMLKRDRIKRIRDMTKEDIGKLIGQEEGTELEYKSAKGGFPESFWETFSAFANTHGGIIVFGIKEKDGRLIPDGLDDSQIAKYKKTFWDCAHNKGKVSATMLAYFYAGSHSICRNPTLQKLFMFLGNGEKAGSGADIIRKGWDDNHWPAPELSERTQPDETMMTLQLVHVEKDQESKHNVGENVGESVGDDIWSRLTERQRLIVQELHKSPTLSAKTMSESMSVSPRTIERDLQKLTAMGVIAHEGSDFGGEWKVLIDVPDIP